MYFISNIFLPSQAYDFIDQVMSDLAALSVQPVLVYFGTLAQRQEVSSQALMSLLICQIRGAVPDHPDFYLPFCRKWSL